MTGFPTLRMRRRRHNPAVRNLVAETNLLPSQLIAPLFIKHGNNIKQPIASMPGQYQLSVDHLPEEIEEMVSLGLTSFLLFGIPEYKDETGSACLSEDGIIQQAIKTIKTVNQDLLVICDLCLCEYTCHGHCGVIQEQQGYLDVENDQSIQLLAEQAVSLAKAGADIIAPSANLDGMVQAIRQGLDAAGFQHIPILSYAVKFASSFYGPFRDAGESVPEFGDRKTYQMDPANGCETLLEAKLDVREGADMLMVKPAHTYLDIIHKIKTEFPAMPLGAYHVSGEYAMIKAAAAKGWVDEKACTLEALVAMRRAGADFIITYAAKDVCHWLAQ